MTSRMGVLLGCLNVLRGYALGFTDFRYSVQPNYKDLVSVLRQEFEKYVPELGVLKVVSVDEFCGLDGSPAPDLSVLKKSALFGWFTQHYSSFAEAVQKVCPRYRGLSDLQWCLVFFAMLSQVRFQQNGDLLLMKYHRMCLSVGYSPLAEACRGVSFVVNKDWSVTLCAWPYEKFYNIGEPAGLTLPMLIGSVPSGGFMLCAEKMDGCLVIVSSRKGVRKNRLVVTTAGALDTEQAAFARNILQTEYASFVQSFLRLPAGTFTFMFELVNPAFEAHVVGYRKKDWGVYWLGARNHATGAFWPSEVLVRFAGAGLCPISQPDLLSLRRPKCKWLYNEDDLWRSVVESYCSDVSGRKYLDMEGTVLYALAANAGLSSGVIELGKLKTEGFLAAQRVSNVATPGIVYEAYVDSTLDSMCASIPSTGAPGLTSPVLEIIQLYLKQFRYVGESIHQLALDFHELLSHPDAVDFSSRDWVELIKALDVPEQVRYFLFGVLKGTPVSELLIPFYCEHSSRGDYYYGAWTRFKILYEFFVPDVGALPSGGHRRLVLKNDKLLLM